jgi:hypothetical protein
MPDCPRPTDHPATAAGDQLLVGVPPDVKAALEIVGQYFQALKDNNFSDSTPAPAGLAAALKTVKAYTSPPAASYSTSEP